MCTGAPSEEQIILMSVSRVRVLLSINVWHISNIALYYTNTQRRYSKNIFKLSWVVS